MMRINMLKLVSSFLKMVCRALFHFSRANPDAPCELVFSLLSSNLGKWDLKLLKVCVIGLIAVQFIFQDQTKIQPK